jgi:hypothetical protein
MKRRNRSVKTEEIEEKRKIWPVKYDWRIGGEFGDDVLGYGLVEREREREKRGSGVIVVVLLRV